VKQGTSHGDYTKDPTNRCLFDRFNSKFAGVKNLGLLYTRNEKEDANGPDVQKIIKNPP
jgi:hypothetical protein